MLSGIVFHYNSSSISISFYFHESKSVKIFELDKYNTGFIVGTHSWMISVSQISSQLFDSVV